ncbi:MAG TPA: DUF2147 domain-containing protein [Alphaproteobacteria bacterium]|nr:DUF2147 domain-containing protein [Alphaproteobacteria bacterium]
MSRTIFITAFLIALVSFATTICAAPSAGESKARGDNVSGFWYTEGREGVVELYHCASDNGEDKICGRFHSFMHAREQKNTSLDTHNPDPDKRDRPLCEMQFMGNFASDGQGHYTDGWIYSPRHGQTFSASMTLVDKNTLTLHGYVFVPALGEDQTWTRATKLPACENNS